MRMLPTSSGGHFTPWAGKTATMTMRPNATATMTGSPPSRGTGASCLFRVSWAKSRAMPRSPRRIAHGMPMSATSRPKPKKSSA